MVTGITVEEVTQKALEHVLENHTKEFKVLKHLRKSSEWNRL